MTRDYIKREPLALDENTITEIREALLSIDALILAEAPPGPSTARAHNFTLCAAEILGTMTAETARDDILVACVALDNAIDALTRDAAKHAEMIIVTRYRLERLTR